MTPSTYYLLNLGCAKNQVEGEHIAGMLLAAGWRSVAEPEQAALLLVNTCGFIRPAVEENLEAILGLVADKRPEQRLAVVGCLVGRYGKKLARSLPEVDLLLGPGEVKRLLQHLEHPPADRLAISTPGGVLGGESPRALSTGPGWAYLRVADGCEHGCAFCTIPHIRGRLRSRGLDDVLAEARRLARAGVVELNLVAQDLLSYGKDRPELADGSGIERLLEGLSGIAELDWIRLLYLSPDSLETRHIEAVLHTPKVVPYFDLPLQHIADPVLRAMGRRRSGDELRALLAGIRQRAPEAVLRTTLLVGHPGEGEAEFTELLEYVTEFGFDHLGCFAYQPEAGTRAARLAAPPAKVARARARQIMAAQKRASKARLKRWVNREIPVLVLGSHPESDLLGQARHAGQAPEVDGVVILTDGQARPGTITNCRVTKAHAYDLEGELI